ncbi:helix-turn-helix domain-containing protein, partial [Clostridium saccharoperbutylacetonicum]|uniref:helix-turn-helix domain-containing protein n=1 Tax=Clostridium saccharoperbutylacetonicum TaxID=36745 RepID=UPI0039EC6A0E
AKKLNEVLNLNIENKTRKNKNDGSVGYKIFKLRLDRNMSADKLSLLADISISTVWALERNGFKPSKLTVKKLAKAFNIKDYELEKMLFEN